MTPPPTKYSIELPNTKKPGQTGIYRDAFQPDFLTANISPGGLNTLYENFQYALKISRDRRCLAHRPFNKKTGQYEPFLWQTYKQVAERVTDFGSGLLYLNDSANSSYSLISVALYDTLGPDTVEYVINHAEIQIIVAAINRIPGLIRLVPKIPGIKVIISMDELDDDAPVPIASTTTGKVLKSWAQERNIVLLDFLEVEKLGQQHPYKHNPPSPRDIATICYTSGTTGVPKGAIITHGNFAGEIGGVKQSDEGRSQDDVIISYLPLAHIYGRSAELAVISYGASIGYFRGDILTLIDDIAELKPTLFASVPRLLTRIFAKIQQATIKAPGIKGSLSRNAVSAKLDRLEKGLGYTHPLWDRIIFNKIKQVLGGRVRLIHTGSAPISPEILQYLRVFFSCEVLEGYGQTEGIACQTLSHAGENKSGHVGGPIRSNEIKLVDVPEMNYFSTDKPFPRGELCFRGPNAFLGYFKDEAKTKETIDEEGWVHTGDIASIDERDSLRSFLAAIVVPDPETFVPWANELTGLNVSLGDEKGLESLVKNDQVRKAFLGEMNKIGKEFKLRGFEFVKVIHLTHCPFSIENNLLTPTLKLKRNDCRNHFKDIFEKLYVEYESENGNNEIKAKL
ncbi:8889_t:CDS:10 [Diversispora eburnea]|uniref:8889_t:CDS:1 n=1 Tax=Diversispora eburnea TaxID=1213867 RepID=A0A9N8YPI6_9GLOM|nr:8889_t:CDS:10 [Diversispora eburnea]